MPDEMLFMNRLSFGFRSMLARLDLEVNYAEVEGRFLPRLVIVAGASDSKDGPY